MLLGQNVADKNVVKMKWNKIIMISKVKLNFIEKMLLAKKEIALEILKYLVSGWNGGECTNDGH